MNRFTFTFVLLLAACGPTDRKSAIPDIRLERGAARAVAAAPHPIEVFRHAEVVAEQAETRAKRCQDVANWTFEATRDWPALKPAIRRGDWATVSQYLAMGARNPPGLTAAETRRVARVRTSLAMIPAAAGGDLVQLRRLLAQGGDPNLTVSLDEYLGPLAWAARCDQAPALKLLLARGAGVNLAYEWAFGLTHRNSSPLNNASRAGAFRTVKLLLSNGADPDMQERILNLKAGDREPAAGNTPLLTAQTHEVMRALLEGGADPDRVDGDGWTALMKAARRNDPEGVSLLLGFGADKERRNKEGQSATDIARAGPCPKALAALTAVPPPPATRTQGPDVGPHGDPFRPVAAYERLAGEGSNGVEFTVATDGYSYRVDFSVGGHPNGAATRADCDVRVEGPMDRRHRIAGVIVAGQTRWQGGPPSAGLRQVIQLEPGGARVTEDSMAKMCDVGARGRYRLVDPAKE